MNPVLQAALRYADAGIPVIPLHTATLVGDQLKCSCGATDCVKSAGKHPRTPNGVKDASTDTSVIYAWFRRWPDSNLGIATGSRSGVWVLDIDPRNGGNISLDDLIAKHGALPETTVVSTGSGGFHYWFRAATTVRNGSIAPGIDVKGDGGYVVAPPSKTAQAYDWFDCEDPFDTGFIAADAPKWLASMLDTRQTKAPKHSQPAFSAVLSEEQVFEIRSALATLTLTDTVEDYAQWLKVGMALHSTKASTAFQLWCEWSSACPEKFDLGTCREKWATFDADHRDAATLGSLFYLAEQAGWQRPLREVKVKAAPEVKPITKASSAWPDQLFKVPGVLQEFVDWALRTAPSQQPELTVMAAISLGATAMARRYSWFGTRTNMIQVSVAPSGTGKEHPRSCIKQALRSAGLAHRLLGEDFKSGTAVFRATSRTPDGLALIDEFGMYLQGVTGANAAPHKREVMEQMMKLSTSANTVVIGPEYADQKANPRVDIEYPCLGILGTTTSTEFVKGLNRDAVSSGFLGRCLLWGTNRIPDLNIWVQEEDVPANVSQWLAKMANYSPEGRELEGVDPKSPILMITQVGVQEVLEELVKDVVTRRRSASDTDLTSALIGRTFEHVKRVAMVVAGSTWDGSTSAPVVTVENVQWAVAYVSTCMGWVDRLVATEMHDSSYIKLLNEVKALIESKGPSGASERDMVRGVYTFRASEPRVRESVLRALAAEGIMGPVTVTTGGRPRKVWIAESHVEESSLS